MSPRPKNIRKVNNMPSVAGFRPVISNNSIYNHRTTKTNQKYPSVNL